MKLVRFDWAIKYLLRNKTNFDILEGFLSELLKKDIFIETILDSESNKNHAYDKSNRVDLLVRTEKNEQIIIEVQCASEWDYMSRILYGASKVITEYMRQGDNYKSICKVISVSIVFFDIGDGEDYIYEGKTVFKGRHCHDILKLNQQEQRIYELEDPADIYPEFHIIKVNQFHEKIKDKFDEWVYFLKNEQIRSTFQAKGIHSAAEKLDILKLSEEERRSYERYQDDLHYEASMILSREIDLQIRREEIEAEERAKGRVEGRVIGRAEGHAEGRAEGHAEGHAEGELESLKKVAREMMKEGIPIDKIKKFTGLSEENITNLTELA